MIHPPGKDYNRVLDSVEAMRLVCQYKISGFSLRRMSLVRKVGCESHFFDSCDKSTWIQYYYANKVAFCDGILYYRQDNPMAITKGVHRYNYDHLATIDEFLSFMSSSGIPYKLIREVAFHFLPTRRWLQSQLPLLCEDDAIEAAKILKRSRRFQMRLALKRLDFGFVEKLIRPKRFIKLFLLRACKFVVDRAFPITCLVEFLESRLDKVSGGLKRDERFQRMVRNAQRLNCSVGRCTYFGKNVFVGSPETTIGAFCSFASNITIGPSEHPLEYASTSPFFYQAYKSKISHLNRNILALSTSVLGRISTCLSPSAV